MNQKERMIANLPYKAWLDGLEEERFENKKKIYRYNNLPPEEKEEKDRLIKEILGKTGDWINIEAPFHCDYGYNIEVGQWFFANYNFIVLDVGKVKIGDRVQIAPNVAIYTAGHPIHPDSRNSGYEYGIDVTIGNNGIAGFAFGNPKKAFKNYYALAAFRGGKRLDGVAEVLRRIFQSIIFKPRLGQFTPDMAAKRLVEPFKT